MDDQDEWVLSVIVGVALTALLLVLWTQHPTTEEVIAVLIEIGETIGAVVISASLAIAFAYVFHEVVFTLRRRFKRHVGEWRGE